MSSPLRTLLVAPLLLFAPGYALVAALYPEGYRPPDDHSARANRVVRLPTAGGRGLPPSVRLGLSVAASVAVVPAVVFVLGFATATIRVRPVLVVLCGLTLLLTGVAVARRRSVPAAGRVSVPSTVGFLRLGRRYVRTHPPSYTSKPAYRPTSRRGVLLNVAVVVAAAVFVASVGFAVAVPTEGSGFTELYLVTRTDGGEFVARDYPQTFGGDAEPLYVTVENHEGGARTYTVVAELQRVDRTPNGTRIVEERRLDSFRRRVEAGETVRIEHRPNVTVSGPDYRIRYLLYVGDPPADPGTDDAYLYVQLWLGAAGSGDGDQVRVGDANRSVSPTAAPTAGRAAGGAV